MHKSKIILNPYTLWDMGPAAFLTLNLTTDRDSMSNYYPQNTITNLELTYIHCFLHCNRWIVKGRYCASVWHFTKKNANRMLK